MSRDQPKLVLTRSTARLACTEVHIRAALLAVLERPDPNMLHCRMRFNHPSGE
jgi:hypothetical protein